MDPEIKIDKIFGNDNHDEIRFANEIDKSQYYNIHSNNNYSSKLLKQIKINVSPFKKQLTKNENDYFNKKDKKKYLEFNNDDYYSEFMKKVTENEKVEKYKSTKLQKKKTMNNQIKQKDSAPSMNVLNLKNVTIFNKNNINEEKKLSSSKNKKKKETNIKKNNSSNLNSLSQKISLMHINNKINFIQNSIQLEIKSHLNNYKELKIERINMPVYWDIKENSTLNNKSNNLNPKFIKDNTIETENNFKTKYNVKNKKKYFLCCF